MVAVLAHVVEVVVFAARTDAFLAVDGALELGEGRGGVDGAEEDGLVLIHAGIGEEEGGIGEGDDAGGGDEGVGVLFAEVAGVM